jgi:hypothetical protein
MPEFNPDIDVGEAEAPLVNPALPGPPAPIVTE